MNRQKQAPHRRTKGPVTARGPLPKVRPILGAAQFLIILFEKRKGYLIVSLFQSS
jgi:hypothetical protein